MFKSSGRSSEHAPTGLFENARNKSSLDLHATLGFVEVTRNFWFPDLTFDGGEEVLARASLDKSTR